MTALNASNNMIKKLKNVNRSETFLLDRRQSVKEKQTNFFRDY